ncbi:MAG: hypothetical protein WAV04_01050 [Candidatus Microsaccharimonas sp.]
MTVEHPVDRSITPMSENSERVGDESYIALDIIEAGIAKSRQEGFAILKVQIEPGTQWIPLSIYLSGRPFYSLKIDNKIRSAIQAKYTAIARRYDHADDVPASSPEQEVVIDEPTLERATDASMRMVEKHTSGSDLGKNALHGARLADYAEKAAGDYERE